MINGINHITLSVRDINESFEFYKNILSFKPIMKSHFSAYLTINNIWIALQEEMDIDHNANTYSHIALNVDKTDYDIVVQILKQHNVIEWKSNDTEGDSFYFLDPSGNKFEIHYSNLKNRIEYGKSNWDKVEWFV